MSLVRAGNFLFKRRTPIFPLVLVAIGLATTRRSLVGDEHLDRDLDFVGAAVAVLGQALRGIVIGLAYIKRGGMDKKVYASALVQEGVFAHSRNPLYLGNLMIYTGLFLILNSLWGYLVGLPFFVAAYLTIVRAEEDYLGRRFGPVYQDYCRRVNRFFPALAGFGRTVAGMEFDWRRLVRKEFGATFAWISAGLAALVWGDTLRFGSDGARPTLEAALLLWVMAILGYVAVLCLKKAGKLETSPC